MKLYIKQKVFSIGAKFSVKDEAGNDRYFVEGEILTLGRKLHIYDINNSEVAFVRQKLLTFMPKFTVEVGGEEVAEIVKQLTLFKPKYYVGMGWLDRKDVLQWIDSYFIYVDGDLFSHDYVITSGNDEIVSIHKAWMSWGDTYELDISDDTDEITALAVVLAIDTVLDNANSND